ncbi:MAG TPA: hypothetical protein VLE53_13595 [Gemmatimonadaceae bacterium]|nr:hypothetical protein [Gemmatimonadaceae bacterium]
MNPHLRDRIVRHLESLPDERAYQVLDYIEFLESKYAERAPASASVFQRFTEGVEDTLRAGRVSTAAIAETMGLLNRAVGVLSGVAAAGRSVASDIVTAASRATSSAPVPPADATAAAPVPAEPLPEAAEPPPPVQPRAQPPE